MKFAEDAAADWSAAAAAAMEGGASVCSISMIDSVQK